MRISRDGTAVFRYPAKSGQERHLVLHDPDLVEPLTTLRRRRGGVELLAYRSGGRRRAWLDVTSGDINAYVKELLGEDTTAKDFRTWHGTVRAALALAAAEQEEAASETARKKLVNTSVKQVAEYLGKTPTVARSSYIDSRVIDAFEAGETVAVTVVDAMVTGSAREHRLRAGWTRRRTQGRRGEAAEAAEAAAEAASTVEAVPAVAERAVLELLSDA